MQFEVNVAPVGAWTVMALAGDVDVATAPRLRAEAQDLVANGHIQLVVDLDAVDFLDSTGLGVLLGVLRRVRAAGGQLRIVCAADRLHDVFTAVSLERVFDLHRSLDDAVGRSLDPAAVGE